MGPMGPFTPGNPLPVESQGQLPPPGLSGFLGGAEPTPDTIDMGEMAQAEFLGGEEEQAFEPPPRPIDWRVKKYWDDPVERARLGRWLSEEIDRYYEQVDARMQNLQTWRDDYDLMPWDGPVPWTGAATLRGVFTSYVVDAHASRLNAQIVELERPVVAEPLEAAAFEAVEPIEEAMAGRLEESEWRLHASQLHHELPLAGNCFLRVQWERIKKRVPFLQVDLDEDAYWGLLLAGADPVLAQVQALKRDRRGAIKFSLGWQEIVTYEGATYKTIPFEDGILWPLTARESQDARAIGERLILTGMELKQGAKAGLYIEEEVEALMALHSDALAEEQENAFDRAGLEVMDAEGPMALHDPLYREYLCHRFSLRLDGNDDGYEEILLVTLHCDTRRILDIRYSQYEHGEHIYHHFPFKRHAGQLLGYGEAERITVIQDAESARLNQEANHADLAVTGSTALLIPDNAMLDPDDFEFRPGKMIPVRDPRMVLPIPFRPLPAEHAMLGQRYKDMVDLVTGTSNPSLGLATDTDRTAREVTIVASEANRRFEGVAQDLAPYWSRVWDQVRSIEAQFNQNGEVRYRKNRAARAMAATGAEMFGTIEPETLLAKVKLVPAGLRQLSDLQSRLQQAQLMNGVFRENPLTAQNPRVWRLALRATMEAAQYPPKDEVMAEVDRTLFASQLVETAETAAVLDAASQAQLRSGPAGPKPTPVPDAAPVPGTGGPGPGVVTGGG